jgi:hypothetical protein
VLVRSDWIPESLILLNQIRLRLVSVQIPRAGLLTKWRGRPAGHHGLSAASVFGDVIGARLLTASFIGLCVALPGL